MRFLGRGPAVIALMLGPVFSAFYSGASAAELQSAAVDQARAEERVELGRRMYMEGLLPSGETMSAVIQGDIELTGEQVVCGFCHRRSGLGSSEGQEVVPAVTGDILYEPLRTPTSKPPLAPELRPAYTDATLKRAIQGGIGADGKALSVLMPRYRLTDEDLDSLLAYLKVLTTDPDPGVTDRELHFATVVSDSVDAETRKAFLDVFDVYVAQKNTETRNESYRAEHAPWHKQWIFGPYRKWVLHVWELEGEPESWPEQLRAQYQRQPVFALLSGLVPGSWRPIHNFCEGIELPCLFPTTDLPVINEQDFFSVYLSKGMVLEADAIIQHLSEEGLLATPVVQVYRAEDPRAVAAAAQLRSRLDLQGGRVTDFVLSGPGSTTETFWGSVLKEDPDATQVLWLAKADLDPLWDGLEAGAPRRLYLSMTLYDAEPVEVPLTARDGVYFVSPYELPGKLPRLLARSTGWLRSKRIYAPKAKRVQANAFFTLKMAGEAVRGIRGFFLRDYLLERIEHMVDNASYTSVYPRISLAPGQRFVSRAAYIAKFKPDGSGDLTAVTGWLVPGSGQ